MNGPSQSLSKTLKRLFPTASGQCESLLHHCATAKSLPTTKKLHAHVITLGLLSDHTHFLSLLISAYAICGQVNYACKLFDELSDRTLLSYKAMIRMYTENGFPLGALKLFVEMLESCRNYPDRYTYPFVIRACGDLVLLDLGVVVHGLTVKSGFGTGTFVGNCLLAMYMKCGDKDGARRVFNAMKEKGVVSWNTMISGYFRNDSAKEAVMVFREMVNGGVEADCATVLSVLPACGYLKNLEVGREVHLLVEEKCLGKRLAVQNALMDMYVKCGRVDEASRVFYGMVERDVVTWTTMINGYILHANWTSAVELCQMMQIEGVRPNEVTLASLLAACTNLPDLRLGRCLHGWAIRHKLECDVNVETALIDLYAKCNCVKLSFRVFSRTSKKRTVPWNAVLSGCVHNKLARESLELFKQMLLEEIKPDDATWKSLLPAYAMVADLQQTLNIHGYLVRAGFISKTDIATGLVDIYSKCGSLELAHKLFDGISKKNRDIVSWSVIIAGYGMHGHGEVALSLFNQMVQSGVEPNEVTFTSVLHACSHVGLVDDGLKLFNFMHKNYQESLRTDHYTCMVDLLGRADRLEEAYELIKSMPFKPNHSVWGALLGACVIHENVELGEVAANWLFELEPENTGNYVLMGNIYSALGRWTDAENVRRMMDNIGLVKAPAHSAVEVRNM
ncbi:pentatricopeptide repeat-containing protein At5g39350 [Olea europaea var. sylvestris]|uniref:pentatricopeptide repeat-containing protein At5g39350 n=1 Tax=Olea europaea var. sylvestris TaxID=158386 RepID=UPI000C1CDDD5|nr:pentatricopeptide repeat-containing protein At5g39350 [Olea europaea var. sylvestris]